MPNSSVYELLHKMDAENIVLAYKGEINADLLEAVYSMLDRQLEDTKISPDRKKKLFHILIECLQNVFHHQASIPKEQIDINIAMTGFVIKNYSENSYSIITGNYVLKAESEKLKRKIDEVNAFSPEELRFHYQQTLAGNEFSEKGGAGLGIIEMARKSGNKLNYEFTNVNNEYSFFSLAITIP
jgi:hypothetical protein